MSREHPFWDLIEDLVVIGLSVFLGILLCLAS